ncbi:hypothetical protein KI387_030813, partial [Taxus chinensis]
MLEDMFMFGVDNPSTGKILLISKKDFYPSLWSLDSLSTFLVAVPDLKATDNYFYRVTAKFVWEWPEVAMDGCKGMRALTIQMLDKHANYVVMNAPFTAVHFATYEAAKKVLTKLSLENASEEHLLAHITAGGVVGALASVVTTPLDVIKTRLQCQSLGTTVCFLPLLRRSVGVEVVSEHTTIEMIGTDGPGILSKVFSVLTDLGYNVVEAEVWTHNTRVACI